MNEIKSKSGNWRILSLALLLMFALLVDRPAGPAASAARAVDPTRVASVAGATAPTTLERDLTFDAALKLAADRNGAGQGTEVELWPGIGPSPAGVGWRVRWAGGCALASG